MHENSQLHPVRCAQEYLLEIQLKTVPVDHVQFGPECHRACVGHFETRTLTAQPTPNDSE